ncbi:MAG: hypothetical protein MUE81_20890 [Thermoflexibacter sp.]|jgi:hypothetical protein|nr:hypothetical protein [Thermoflexibacter sp.]
MKKQGEFGFVLKVNKSDDFKNPLTYKATIALEIDEIPYIKDNKHQIIFSYPELTHYDGVYNKAIEIAIDYLLRQTITFGSFRINIVKTYWFDLQSSPPITVAYATYFALYKALSISLPSHLKPSFDVFSQQFIFPNFDNTLLNYETLLKEYQGNELILEEV